MEDRKYRSISALQSTRKADILNMFRQEFENELIAVVKNIVKAKYIQSALKWFLTSSQSDKNGIKVIKAVVKNEGK